MKSHLFLLIFCLSASALISQNPEIDRLHQQINKNIFKKPDSAKFYLFKILDYSAVRHDTAVARTYSKLGISYNQLGAYDSATYYFKKGIHLVTDNPLIKAQLLCNLAINYRTNAEYSKSMEALKDALSIYNALNDLNGKGVVYGEMASNYNYMAQKEKAITFLKKAISIFRETNDPRLYILQQKLGNAYFNNGNFEFALEIYEQVLPEFEKEKGAPYYLTLLAYAESLITLGKDELGETRLLEAMNGLREVNNLEYMQVAQGKLAKLYFQTNRPALAAVAFEDAYTFLRNHNSIRFLQIAADYLEFLNDQGDYNRATRIISEVREATNNYKFKMNGQDELRFIIAAEQTYRIRKQFELSLETYDRINFLKDSIRNAEDRIKIAELEEAYENEIQREKNIALLNTNFLLSQSNKKDRNITLLSSILTILIFLLSIAFYFIYRKKLRLQKDALIQLKMANSILSEKQELEQELFIEKEKRLGDKERELVAISLEAADVQNQIREVLESKRNKHTSEICNQIENIIGQRNYWKHFKTKFVEVHPEFSHNLIHMFPVLTDNDIAFCSLLKLQLTNKEIASLLGISHQSVISKKYRIKKKMELQGNDESFDELMREL